MFDFGMKSYRKPKIINIKSCPISRIKSFDIFDKMYSKMQTQYF